MQYMGRLSEQSYLGEATQNDKVHVMFQSWGVTSHNLIPLALATAEKCTRIDIQVTTAVNTPNLLDLASRLKKRKRTVGYIESGGLATCYIGSFKSPKVIRVYMKDLKTLRFEVMYKGLRAHAMFDYLVLRMDAYDGAIIDQLSAWLRHEVNATGDEWLSSVFESALPIGGKAEKTPAIKKTQTNTEKWLNDVVLGTFAKYALSHDADHTLLEKYQMILDVAKGARDEQEHNTGNE
jgi:hypothetical protein